MPDYDVEVGEQVSEFLQALEDKSRRICVQNLKKLAKGPYPGRGPGDKERLFVRGEEIYRIHISRTYTAFYVVIEKKHLVRVIELLHIEDAHKKYGYK